VPVHRCLGRYSYPRSSNTHGHECQDGNEEKARSHPHAYSRRRVSTTFCSDMNPPADEHSVCAVSITRVIATYSIAKEYVKHPDDVIYYTAPVFFWTNIELSLAIVCACLPTLRPIWFRFHPRQPTTKNSSLEYGSSKLTGSKRQSTFGTKYGSSRKPYKEIDELELTRYEHDHEQASSVSVETGPRSVSQQGIRKDVTIHQTPE
jgi:hypothetical protein